MKSQHRHELETNWLAHNMAGWIERLKPHSTKLLTVVGIVVGLLLVVSISASVSVSKDKAAWEAYSLAMNTTDPELMQLQQVAEEYPGTTMQEWAYATWADRQLLIASSRYLIDRDAVRNRLRNVQGIYESITQAGNPQIRDRAHLGLARIYEMLDQLDKAQTEYALVAGDLAPMAKERSSQLEAAEVQQSCQWLATAALPKRAAANGSGLSGTKPPFEAISPATGSPATGSPATGRNDQSLKSIEELLNGPITTKPMAQPDAGGKQGADETKGQIREQAPGNRYGEQTEPNPKPAPKTPSESKSSPAGESQPSQDSAHETGTEKAPAGSAPGTQEATTGPASTTKP